MTTSFEILHANCLNSQKPTDCPVCYYQKNPDILKKFRCMECLTEDSLGICISCGHIGCGGICDHAFNHYKRTQHEQVMHLQEFKVWNYKTGVYDPHSLSDNQQEFENAHETDENICSCLVCQYIKVPKLLEKSSCMSCEANDEGVLWICLSCSCIGCGRSYNEHALEHYKRTGHRYTMQMYDFGIWDYHDDKYLHRHLHDVELLKIGIEQLLKTFVSQTTHLGCQLEEIRETTSAMNMVDIEQRLLSLTDGMIGLEHKLDEHEVTINNLITQYSPSREKRSPLKLLKSVEAKTEVTATELKSPNEKKTLLPNSEFLFSIYYFLRLCGIKIFQFFKKNIIGFINKLLYK